MVLGNEAMMSGKGIIVLDTRMENRNSQEWFLFFYPIEIQDL